MSTIALPGEYEVNGKKIVLDEDGFLQNPEAWDESVAEWMAKNLEGVERMTERHWRLVKYLRQYWEANGICPSIRMIIRETGESLLNMYELFPHGPALGACKVAGVPRPTGCI